jgi:hypothetical protein
VAGGGRSALTAGRALKRLALAALCLLLAGCGGGEKREPPEPSAFVGVVSEDTFDGDAAYRERELPRLVRSGVGLLRQPFYWGLVEKSRGSFDFAALDRYVESVTRHGIQLLPILFGTPDFRSSAPPPDRRARGTYPPASPAAFARFAGAAVRRYGPDGSFWSEHPRLPAKPVHAWQVWNEPNLPQFWASGPDPAAYTRLLRAAAAAIRQADPRARVVSAGLSFSRHGIPFERFLRGMYGAGAGDAIDVVAVHPYAPDAEATLDLVRRARALLRELGRSEPIWVTEFGWASGGPPSQFTVDEAGQAARTEAAIRALERLRTELGIAGIVYYNWRDRPPSPDQPDFFGLNTGLTRDDGSAKPALEAFRRAARR